MNEMTRSRLALAASWQAKGATRGVGLLLALDLGVYSFIAPFVSFVALLPSIVLLPAWFILVARSIGRGAEERQEVVDRPASARPARTTADAIIGIGIGIGIGERVARAPHRECVYGWAGGSTAVDR
jgi:hypothetical protein